jgi:acetyl-CoA C-acetyltransferase
MRAASAEALQKAGATIDDVAHLDLYSCFASSLHFACDALDIDPTDPRRLTVTGGLPYHGGPGSGYLTHSIATMTDVLRADPGSLGMISGVGMHMTKHVYGCYSTTPAPLTPPDERAVQARLGTEPPRPITAEYTGDATVAAYSVVHGRAGEPEWGLLVCDLPDGERTYAKVVDGEALAQSEQRELVGRPVHLELTTVKGPMGDARVNVAVPA